MSNQPLTGRYVTYVGRRYLVTGTRSLANNKKRLLRLLAADGSKRTLPEQCVTNPSSTQCKRVEFSHALYLVTPKGAIVSLKTGRIMQWGDTHGARRAILALAAA